MTEITSEVEYFAVETNKHSVRTQKTAVEYERAPRASEYSVLRRREEKQYTCADVFMLRYRTRL